MWKKDIIKSNFFLFWGLARSKSKYMLFGNQTNFGVQKYDHELNCNLSFFFPSVEKGN